MLPPTTAELPQTAGWWPGGQREERTQRHRAELKMQRPDGFTERRYPEDAKTWCTHRKEMSLGTHRHRHTDTQSKYKQQGKLEKVKVRNYKLEFNNPKLFNLAFSAKNT